MRGSDILVEMLIQYGVTHVFGVPGDTSVILYESLARRSREISHIMCRDERSASFMADAYARLTNRPGVCESPSGAGALYTLPGVAEANASSVPVIALTSGIDLASENKGAITELDHHAIYNTITKWSTFLKRYNRIPDTLRRAFRVATSGRPGAVHIAFPQEILHSEVPGGEKDIYAEPSCRHYPASRSRADDVKLLAAADLLTKAERPVIVAGGGIWISGARDALLELAELLTIPVATTVTGKGAILEDHPLAIGVTGDNGYREYAHDILRNADLIFFTGCKTGSVATCSWTLPDAKNPPEIIHLDVDPCIPGNNYRTSVDLIGDARTNLEALLSLLRSSAPSPKTAVKELIGTARSQWLDAAAGDLGSTQIPLKPQRVMSVLMSTLPDRAVIIADAGTPTPYLCACFEVRSPECRVIIPRAYGGLGYAIPAAVGASLARPGVPIIALTGDGSFGMSCGELETIARMKIPVVILIFNNGCFGWIKAIQSLHTDLGSPGLPYYSVDFTRSDHAAIARTFGLQAHKVESASELEPMLSRALATQQPVLLDLPSEPEISTLPPVRSWKLAAEK